MENVKIVAAMVFVSLVGFGMGVLSGTYRIQQQAIAHKVAYHEPDTGSFTWGSYMKVVNASETIDDGNKPPPITGQKDDKDQCSLHIVNGAYVSDCNAEGKKEKKAKAK